MLVATGNDVRVMSIKLADRLHNMRTLGVMRPEKQARIAKVTRDVLIPLAERLGVQALKTELEDLVFAILHPEEYEHTRALIADNAGRAATRSPRSPRTCGRCCARPASPPKSSSGPGTSSPCTGSRLKRGELRGADFGRLLVLVDEDADCYARPRRAAHLFHPGDLGVQGLHRRPQVQPVPVAAHRRRRRATAQVAEVLIRTHQMHKVAEAGVVALGNPYAAGPREAPAAERRRRRRARRPDPARLALPAPRLAAGRPRPRHLLDRRCATTSPRTARSPSSAPTAARSACPPARAAWTPRTRSTARTRTRCIGARVNGRLATLSTVLQRRRHRPAAAWRQDPASGPSPGVAGARPHARRPDRHQPAGSPPTPTAPAADRTRPRRRRGPAEARRADGAGPPRRRRTAAAAASVVVDLPGATVRLAGCCTPVPPDDDHRLRRARRRGHRAPRASAPPWPG